MDFLSYRWSCDDSVTHYIYQGKVGDNSKEYKAVKERGLHIVSQHWLQAVCTQVHLNAYLTKLDDCKFEMF